MKKNRYRLWVAAAFIVGSAVGCSKSSDHPTETANVMPPVATPTQVSTNTVVVNQADNSVQQANDLIKKQEQAAQNVGD